jgi:hypothetical protein
MIWSIIALVFVGFADPILRISSTCLLYHISGSEDSTHVAYRQRNDALLTDCFPGLDLLDSYRF